MAESIGGVPQTGGPPAGVTSGSPPEADIAARDARVFAGMGNSELRTLPGEAQPEERSMVPPSVEFLTAGDDVNQAIRTVRARATPLVTPALCTRACHTARALPKEHLYNSRIWSPKPTEP